MLRERSQTLNLDRPPRFGLTFNSLKSGAAGNPRTCRPSRSGRVFLLADEPESGSEGRRGGRPRQARGRPCRMRGDPKRHWRWAIPQSILQLAVGSTWEVLPPDTSPWQTCTAGCGGEQAGVTSRCQSPAHGPQPRAGHTAHRRNVGDEPRRGSNIDSAHRKTGPRAGAGKGRLL